MNNSLGELIKIEPYGDFNKDNRFKYYYDTSKIIQDRPAHYLIDKGTGRIFVEAYTYPQMISKYWFKIEIYNQYISTDAYKNLVKLYERSLNNVNTKESNKGA